MNMQKRAAEVIRGLGWDGGDAAEVISSALAEATPPILMQDPPAPSRSMTSPEGQVWYTTGPLADIRATAGGIVAFGSWKDHTFRVLLTPDQADELAGILTAGAHYTRTMTKEPT